MKRQHKAFNSKRRIAVKPSIAECEALSKSVRYRGSPHHKRNPGDYGLTPPSNPRSDKTLCDPLGIDKREIAEMLLRAGAARGLISEQKRGKYPQNIWSVTEDGQPLEAQLDDKNQGTYHGYPMPQADIFRETVLKRWRK